MEADPGFAEAHAELALAYVIRLFLYAPEEKQLEQKANREVERALALNPNLASAYLARGRLKWTPFHHFPHEDAINDFKRALVLDPNLNKRITTWPGVSPRRIAGGSAHGIPASDCIKPEQ